MEYHGAPDDPLTVDLVGALGLWRPSMDRFQNRLREGLVEFGVTPVAPTLAPGSGSANPLVAKAGGWVRRWIRYPVSARRVRADVHHVTDHSVGHVLAALPSGRSVVTCHDLILLHAADAPIGVTPPRRWLWQFRLSVSQLRRAAVVVAVSEATKAEIVKYLGIPPERIRVVPNGVDPAFRPATAEAQARTRADLRLGTQYVIVQIGNAAYKNVSAALRTLAEVRRRGVDAVLVHIGEDLDDEHARLAVSLGVVDQVRQLGRVEDDVMIALLQAADVLLFPSLWEGFGLPPLEAMACGLPVVCSDIAPVREVVGDAGLFAAPDDVDALAGRIVDLASDPSLTVAKRAAGLERAALFSWPSVCRRYAEIYRELATGR